MSFTLEQVLRNKSNVVHCVLPSETVQNAAIKMAEKGIGALLVMEDKKIVGIFTERDIVNKLFKQCLNPCEATVEQLMTRQLTFAKSSTTIEEAMATFTQHRFRHLPVVENEQLLGMVSIGDVTKWLLTKNEQELTYLSQYIRGDIK
ncbi:MAG: CBS domain-containing protein [Gammaproteobacteria bacterium]|nr:CBS domain-containing protein [Gammaproteobacteria bacterium]